MCVELIIGTTLFPLNHKPEIGERFKRFGAPVDGDGVAEAGRGEPCGSGMHSFRRSLQQYIEAASGSRAMISCFGFSESINPAYSLETE